MREILYRAKRLDNGEWVEGYYLQTGSEYHGAKKHLIAIDGRICDYAGNEFVEVDPLTIGEFTGLCDKNGVKIFEGDIIRVKFEADCLAGQEPESWSELFEIAFDDEHHAWFTKLNDGELGEWMYEYDGECEVINNIHDKTE